MGRLRIFNLPPSSKILYRLACLKFQALVDLSLVTTVEPVDDIGVHTAGHRRSRPSRAARWVRLVSLTGRGKLAANHQAEAAHVTQDRNT
jgi:hypothetical protein